MILIILIILIGILALTGLIGTLVALPRDGYRQIPTDPRKLP